MRFLLFPLYFIAMSFYLNADHLATEVKNPTVNSLQVFEELEICPESSLDNLLQEFSRKKGKVIIVQEDSVPFTFLPGDIIFPSCSAASHRSQVVWNLFRPYSNIITLKPPHATRYGFDPYNGKANWLAVQRKLKSDEEYPLWAGVNKSPILGWDVFQGWWKEKNPPQKVLDEMYAYYNENYYHFVSPEKNRKIYITFEKNAHIHLCRFNQVNESLENVILLVFPLIDLVKYPPEKWETVPRSQKCFSEFAKLLIPFFDFSQLRGCL